MCVANTSSWQDQLLAQVRKVQALGIGAIVEYDTEMLETEGRFIIDSVQFDGKGFGPYPCGALAASEAISNFLAKRIPAPDFNIYHETFSA
jgi:hypothetical protein